MNSSTVVPAAAGPLAGVRVLDFSRVLSGPAATMLMADQGADVIKIEPLNGDITRQMGVGQNGITSAFLNINRGKRGLALDLRNAESAALVRALIPTADVMVQNFRPGAIDKMGFGYDAVKALNPNIIFVSISGFGGTGPYAGKRVYDPVIQALSGITDIQADTESGRPRMIRTVIPDKTTAMTAAQAICAALFQRERHGCGCHIELAMLDATIAYLWPEGMINYTLVESKHNKGIGQLAQDLIFETTDGYITAGAMSDQEWRGMCEVLDKPQWVNDPRFNSTAGRFNNAKERIALTAEVLLTQSKDYWLPRLDAAGVPCAPVLTRAELLEHEQVRANDLISAYAHPELGKVRQPRPAAQFTEHQPNRAPLAPALGEHSREILGEIGISDQDINQLIARGIVADGSRG